MHRWLNAVGIIAIFLYGIGFLGWLHPALDAIAIGRWAALYAALGLFLCAALLQKRAGLAGSATVALAFGAAAHLWSTAPGPAPPSTLRIYSKKLLYRNPQQGDLAQDIIATAPDIVFLQEVSRRSSDILRLLDSSYPYQSLCPLEGWNGMAVLSKTPVLNAPACSPKRSLMAVQISTSQGPVWTVNVHLQHPWPDHQWADLELALPVLAAIEPATDKVIAAGDFNTVPWTAAPKTIGSLTGTRPLRPFLKTFTLWGVKLPLDQVWSKSGTISLRPKFGSDHNGLLADIGF